MTDQIDEIIQKYHETFEGRDKEMKDFLIKHFKRDFELQLLENLEKVDASERIQKAGFQKNLSGWRNIYKNITIVSCVKKEGLEKRFDYKFMFIEEKLDEETIEKIEDELKEVDKLKRSFKFEEARTKVDDLLELIKNEEDKVYNKRLYDKRKEINAEEEEYNQLSEHLNELEKEYNDIKGSDDLKREVQICEEIVDIAKKTRNGNLARKYGKILKDAQKELEFKEKLEELEKEFEYNRDKNKLDAAIASGEQIIELAQQYKNKETEEKYKELVEEIKKEIEEMKGKIEQGLAESDELIKNKEYDEALASVDKMLDAIEGHECKVYDDLEKQLKEKRNEIKEAKNKELELADDISELEKKLLKNLEENKIFLARDYCERLKEVSESSKKEDLVDKYSGILDEIDTKISDLKSQIDKIINNSNELADNFQFEEAISDIDDMLKYLGQDLPDYKSKLEDKRKEIITKEEKYREFENEILDLDELLRKQLKERNYVAAYKTCEKIVAISKKTENPVLIKKYEDKLKEIEKNIEEIKEKIDILLEESLNLSKENRFKEALSKIDAVEEIIGEQDLPEEKKKLKNARTEIEEAQERYVKFTDDLTELDKKLEQNLKDKKLMAALSNCDLLLQIAESYNKPELIDRYAKILDEINKKIDEIKQRMDEAIEASDKLVDNHQYDDALSNIDSMLEFLEGQEFPEIKRKLEEKRTDIEKKREKDEQFQAKLKELNEKLQSNMDQDDLEGALSNCKQLITLCNENEEEELVKKYKEHSSELRKKIKEKEAKEDVSGEEIDRFAEFKKMILALSKRAMNQVKSDEMKSALDTYNEILVKFDEYDEEE